MVGVQQRYAIHKNVVQSTEEWSLLNTDTVTVDTVNGKKTVTLPYDFADAYFEIGLTALGVDATDIHWMYVESRSDPEPCPSLYPMFVIVLQDADHNPLDCSSTPQQIMWFAKGVKGYAK